MDDQITQLCEVLGVDEPNDDDYLDAWLLEVMIAMSARIARLEANTRLH